jgi:hypothetical protein
VSRPVYAPTLVAFAPFTQVDRVGWVPLGPGDPYVSRDPYFSRYYDRNCQPQYLGSTTYVNKNVNVTNIVNRVQLHESSDQALNPLQSPVAIQSCRQLRLRLQGRLGRSQCPRRKENASFR